MPAEFSRSSPDSRPGQLAFVVGKLGYDFGSEARTDYFSQLMGSGANAIDPAKMAARLQSTDKGGEGHTDEAEAMIWTLNIDGIPVYAIEPEGQFAALSYLRLVDLLYQQEKEGVERVSIAGTIHGTVRLYHGTMVPCIAPTLRGMFNWNAQALADAAGTVPPADERRAGFDGEFLHRVFYEMRNPGIEPEHRALNFAATNAFLTGDAFKEMAGQGMVFEGATVERSPISRPDSDCWDVQISFFNPNRIADQPRKIYRITVDVSDVVPVTIGQIRSWNAYFGR